MKTMAQLGVTLKQFTHQMATHCNLGKGSKVDLKDGFWRIVVNNADAWNFCCVLPQLSNSTKTIDDTKLVVPHALQMR